MNTSFLFFIIFMVTSSFGSPPDHALLEQQRHEVDFVGNTQVLIRELIEKFRTAALDGLDAVRSFRNGLQEQGKQWIEKLLSDLKKFRERINNTIQNFSNRFVNANSAVQTCIDSFRKEADDIFSAAVVQSRSCADERIHEIGDMIENLHLMSSNATYFASNAVDELKNCTEYSEGFLSAGSCLGGVAVRTEFNGAVFLMQSGVQIARINLALTTLPAALEVCAGSRLVEAGVGSAKIVVEIGTCSASSVYTSLSGNDSS